MVSLRRFTRMANRLYDRIPQRFLVELNGGIIISEEAEQRDPDLPDVYILGEYVEDPYGLGRYIVLYYGSFRALFGDSPPDVWEAELWETLLHEIRHHLESLAGVDDLEIEDMRQLAEFRRWAEEQEHRSRRPPTRQGETGPPGPAGPAPP
ncbi:MAG: metallopeptidase family protein [Firmicutes bacterium]|nr:metallopeptidase family protein [Bacillota bacterium]